MTTRSRLWTQLRVTVRVVRAVLRSPALRRVELAYLTFNAVEFGTWVAILLYAYAAIGPTSVGVVAVVQLVPSAIVAPLSANLGDRFPRDRVLFGGYLIMAAAFGATWLVMAADAPSTLVIIAAAFASASLSVIRSTQGALLPSLARTPEELTAANGLSGMVEGMGLLLGPLIAAAILWHRHAGCRVRCGNGRMSPCGRARRPAPAAHSGRRSCGTTGTGRTG